MLCRIEQEEAKYQNLKKSLVVQQFCPETLPRPKVKRRPNRMQTVGLPKIFGGSLDDYYEATGEKIPLVIESCIRTINLFGMRHQGIFRITGSHVGYQLKFLSWAMIYDNYIIRLISTSLKKHLKTEKILLLA